MRQKTLRIMFCALAACGAVAGFVAVAFAHGCAAGRIRAICVGRGKSIGPLFRR